MKPRTVDRAAFHVVGMSGRFTPETTKDIAALWGRFAPRMASVPGRKGTVSYGVCVAEPHPPPGTTPGLVYMACVEVESPRSPPRDLVAFTVPANRYAVFTHTGHIRAIGETWDAIHHRWLREAGPAKAPGPDFEVYDARWDPATGEGPVDIFVAVVRGT